MRDQDSVAVLQNIRDTYAHMAECHEDEPSGTLAAAWAEACEAGIAALQSQQDGAQGGDAVAVGEIAGLVSGHTGCTDAAAIEAAVAIVDLIASSPAIAPQATPAAVDGASNSIVDDIMFGFRLRSSKLTERDARQIADNYARKRTAALAAPPAEVKP